MNSNLPDDFSWRAFDAHFEDDEPELDWSGLADIETCLTCGGNGVIEVGDGTMERCHDCNGRGTY